ncbi:hypothetical protein I79_025619 [Cricetulus griseus]|uniref:Uncharacterized protein n=1 Tax=Cricetulus griseus TaxID=10029 RepID=G3INT1_CRIGR|nr:hypothetical protein I79_025619 [Cricetulus griseus]
MRYQRSVRDLHFNVAAVRHPLKTTGTYICILSPDLPWAHCWPPSWDGNSMMLMITTLKRIG